METTAPSPTSGRKGSRGGAGIYAILGNPVGRPFSRYAFICPARMPPIYGYGASPAQLSPAGVR